MIRSSSPSSMRVQRSHHTPNVSMDKSLQLTGDDNSKSSSKGEQSSRFSAGSTVSGDSFVLPLSQLSLSLDDDNESLGSYDPYLSMSRRRRRQASTQRHYCLTSKDHRVDPTTPDTMADTLDESLNRDDDDDLGKASSVPDLPTMLSIPTQPSLLVIARRQRDLQAGLSSSKATSSTMRVPLSIESKRRAQYIHQRVYWNALVAERVQHYGTPVHRGAAQGLLDLGHAHMQCHEYKEALNVFTSAVRIYRKLFGDEDLRVALALDKMGRAAWHQNKNHVAALQCASVAVHQALTIRFVILGPTHVDTVETLNHLAAIYLQRNQVQQARQAYSEVYTLRKALFGEAHPSVAVAAHSLGGAYMRLSQTYEAHQYYVEALEIYQGLGLKPENPTVVKLLRDMTSLERIMSTRLYL